MNLHEISQTIALILGDYEPTQATPTRQEFSLLLKINSLKHFKRKMGLPEQYQPGMPLPAQVFEITEKLSQDVRRFKVFMGKKDTAPLMLDTNGYADVPSDMYYPSSFTYRYFTASKNRWRTVDVLTDEEFDRRLGSVVEQPTKYWPVCNFQRDFIRFAPVDMQYINFNYIRYPVDPIYAVKKDDFITVYDAANSTELEWDDINQIDIMMLVLVDLGMFLKREDIIKYATQAKVQGI